MAWSSTAPLGTVSVKANKAILGDNTTYIETTMGNSVVGSNAVTTRDHFWNVDANLDGRHRFIQSPAFTVGAVPADPVVGTSMDGVLYLKTTNSRAQGFFRNAAGVYQYIPSFLSGSVVVTSSVTYSNVVAVPANTYGEIFMYTTALGDKSTASGAFRSNGTVVEAWVFSQGTQSSNSTNALKFSNGSDAINLTIKARAADAASGLAWSYRIVYRAI